MDLLKISEMTSRKGIRCVMFDMDNTLFDFVEAKLAACCAMVEKIGDGNPDELYSYFRRGKYDYEHTSNIRDYLCNIRREDMFDACCDIYLRTKIRSIQLYPGVRQTFDRIHSKGLPIIIVTDAHTDMARARLEQVELLDSVDTLITCDMTGLKKSDTGFFENTLEIAGMGPREVIFVGDSQVRDIIPASKAGIITAHAVYGDRNENEPVDNVADHILQDIQDILKILP